MGQLKRQEPVGAGLRRIACEAVEAGVRALTRPTQSSTCASAEILEAAAVMGLIAHALPPATARRDRLLITTLQAGLEEIERPTRLLARLELHFKKPPTDPALASAVKALRRRWTSQPDPTLSTGTGSFNPVIYRLVADMAQLRGHMGHWPVDTMDAAPLRGLRQTYAGARRSAHQPIAPDSLSAWAEQVAQLGTQIALLVKACPTMLKAQRKLLGRCALAMREQIADRTLDRLLREQLGDSAPPTTLDAEAAREHLRDLTTDLQSALAESPAAFVTRMNAYWSVWRGRAG